MSGDPVAANPADFFHPPESVSSRREPDVAQRDAGRAPAARGEVERDSKDPLAFRTIGEVAKALGIAPHVLRYWEEQFPMLRPVKRSGARRYYRPDDIAMLERIDRLVHAEGYTLRGARQLLEAEARHLRQAGRHHAAASAPGRDPPRDTANVPIAQFADGPTSTAPAPSPGLSATDTANRLRAIRATLADALRVS